MTTAQPASPWFSTGAVQVLGTGLALPGPAVSTDELVDRLTTRFGFRSGRRALAIAAMLGIERRHLCRAFDQRQEKAIHGRANPDLAAEAVRLALAQSGLGISDIGYLIGHTSTPAQLLPANIALVADLLDYSGPHMELRQACTGFANALVIAFGLLAVPGSRPVAIVGSETGSLFFNPSRADENPGQLVNMVQMGDGAAAIVLAPSAASGATIRSAWFGTTGLGRPPGIEIVADRPQEFQHHFEAIRDAGEGLFEAAVQAASQQGVAVADVDVILPHQVSGRIGAQCADYFGLSKDRVFVNASRVGNTGSAAIWLALAELRERPLDPGFRALVLGAEASKYMHGGFVYDHR